MDEIRRMQRQQYAVCKARLSDQGNDQDLEHTTATERLGMMWQLTLDAWAFMEPLDAESRLPRHIVRVLRPER